MNGNQNLKELRKVKEINNRLEIYSLFRKVVMKMRAEKMRV
ncbi:MAG: hypothetical protein ACYC21_03155 [Eubacteriales bacterium]